MPSLFVTEFNQLALDAKGRITQMPEHPPTAIQAPITIGASSAQGGTFNLDTSFIRLQAAANCHYVIGLNPTATTADTPLVAGQCEYVGIATGHRVAVIAGN